MMLGLTLMSSADCKRPDWTSLVQTSRMNFWDWLWCQQQIVSIKNRNHWCTQPRFVCLTSSECPTTVKWMSMSAQLIEWSAQWFTQLWIQWLTSTSTADWNCENWKSLMHIRRLGLSIDLKIDPMVDAEVDWEQQIVSMKIKIIAADKQDLFVWPAANAARPWNEFGCLHDWLNGQLNDWLSCWLNGWLRRQQQIGIVKVGNHWCRYAGSVCLLI